MKCSRLTGEIRSKIDQVWNAFWAGGIANPLEVIEQITYLFFMRGLDDIQTREENNANMLGRPMERVIFPDGVYRTVRDEEMGEVHESHPHRSIEQIEHKLKLLLLSRGLFDYSDPICRKWHSKIRQHRSPRPF